MSQRIAALADFITAVLNLLPVDDKEHISYGIGKRANGAEVRKSDAVVLTISFDSGDFHVKALEGDLSVKVRRTSQDAVAASAMMLAAFLTQA